MNKKSLTASHWIEFLLIISFFCLISLGQLQRFQLGSLPAFYAHDLVAAVLLLWWGGQSLVTGQLFQLGGHLKSLRIWSGWVLVSWIAVGWVGGILAHEPVGLGLLYAGRLTSYVLLMYGLVHRPWWPKLEAGLTGSRAIKTLLVIVGCLMMVFGWLQYWFLPDLRFLGILGWDTHLYRLVGTQLDPTFTGLLLVLTLLILQSLPLGRKLLGYALQLALVLTIAFTYSRATYLALGVSQLLMAWHGRRQSRQAGWSILLIVLLLGCLPLLPRPGGEGVRLERTSTGVSRLIDTQTWLGSMQPWQWLTGRGLLVPLPTQGSASGDQAVPNHGQLPDNLLLLLTMGWGIGGWVALLLILRCWQKRPYISILIWTSLAAILVHAQFNNSLFQIFIWIFLWGILWSEWANPQVQTHQAKG